MKTARRLVLVTVAVLLLAGCGGGGGGDGGAAGDGAKAKTKTFEDDRFGITFEYPDDFRLGSVTDVQKTAGGSSTADQGVGLDDDNAIFVSRYELATEVTEDNVDAAAAELDGVVGDLVGTKLTGRRVDVGGLIAFRYDDVAVTQPAGGQSDLVFLFDGSTQYQLNCQSTAAHRSRMDDACQLAVDTLEAAA